jgi:hypothetical protein
MWIRALSLHANTHDTQLTLSDDLVPSPRSATVLELAEADRYPPQDPLDLHG